MHITLTFIPKIALSSLANKVTFALIVILIGVVAAYMVCSYDLRIIS